MKIIVSITNEIKTEIDSNITSIEDDHIKNVVVRTLPRRNIILSEELNKIKPLKRCNNCDDFARYVIDYEIKYINNIIYFNITNYHYYTFQIYEQFYCGKCLKQKNLNPNSKEFVAKIYGVNTQVANEIILERNKSPFYKTNFQTEEEYKNYQKRDETWYITRYGEIGKEKFKNNILNFWTKSLRYNDKKDSMSLDHFIKKYNGDIERAKKEKIKRNKTVSGSLEKYIERYGPDEGQQKYFEKIKVLSYKCTVEAYIEKYGEKLGKQKFNEWKTKCSCSLDTFIKKYGEEEGNIRYKKWLIGICIPFNKEFFSKESKVFFDNLQQFFKDIKIISERFIYDKQGFMINNKCQHIFFYDAFIEKYNLIIEYDTPAYHLNSTYLTKNEICSIKEKNPNCRRIDNDKDSIKENLALNNGYKFYRVYIKTKKDRKFELEKLINYIKSYDN
jgi:hypothetical protein